jgi:hypothetical protein
MAVTGYVSLLIDLRFYCTLYLQPHEETDDQSCKISLQHEKVPKRTIHFCDGTIEEYSSDEDEPDASTQVTSINPVIFEVLCFVYLLELN